MPPSCVSRGGTSPYSDRFPMPYGGAMTTTEARRRGVKLGVTALILAVIPAVYFGATYLVGLGADGSPGSDDIAIAAEGMMWIGLFLIPGFLLLGFIFGIVALIVDRPLGKILGLIAVLVWITGVVLVVVYFFSPDGPANWTDF